MHALVRDHVCFQAIVDQTVEPRNVCVITNLSSEPARFWWKQWLVMTGPGRVHRLVRSCYCVLRCAHAGGDEQLQPVDHFVWRGRHFAWVFLHSRPAFPQVKGPWYEHTRKAL